MTKKTQPHSVPTRFGRTPWLALMAGVVLGVTAVNGTAQAQAPAAAAGVANPIPADDLVQIVAPIALYPDDLVAIILPASTSPLQIVQADRFLEKRKTDPKAPLDDKWDDAVKSLLNYPDIVKKMSADLDWTSALGEAVVADQGAVLDAVQTFRRKAQSAGNLKSDGKQVVKAEQEIITIVPANPEVIYVPQYNPTTVVVAGAPYWGYYPTPYPSYYYPYAPGAALATGVIWGAALGAAWSGNRYGYGGGNTINVNRNTNINTGNINRGGAEGAGGGSAWQSNKKPGQVSSSVGKSNNAGRVGGSSGGAGGFGGAGGAGAGARPSTQPGGAAGANRGGGAGGGAFGDAGASGRQTQMDSSRGASSRSSASTMGGRSSSGFSGGGGGGGARASGGGGGGARGGGGGGRGGGGRR